ncbi:MAG: GSCFA domain-containing protein [Bacteroidales bacterium]|nr:GSCFA domain-containing protein [Bacteroidales bacterium]
MMKLQTPVTLDPAPVTVSYDDCVLVLGSCFADEIGQRLAGAGFRVLTNPFGTLYNPVSVGNAVARLSSGVPFTQEDVVEMGAGAGKMCSFWHHTSFARDTAEAFLENANKSLDEAAAFWKDCNKVIVTLGTAWAFRNDASGETVANCLKRPAAEFTRYRLTVAQTAAILQGLVHRNSGKQFIFTVSPIRHLADGAHGSQLSKSTLLLATEGLPYFPAYEIMMDELRDYRWWAEDMVHPTQQAAAYLCDRFIEWALPVREWDLYESRMKEWRRSRHRPLYSE